MLIKSRNYRLIIFNDNVIAVGIALFGPISFEKLLRVIREVRIVFAIRMCDALIAVIVDAVDHIHCLCVLVGIIAVNKRIDIDA